MLIKHGITCGMGWPNIVPLERKALKWLSRSHHTPRTDFRVADFILGGLNPRQPHKFFSQTELEPALRRKSCCSSSSYFAVPAQACWKPEHFPCSPPTRDCSLGELQKGKIAVQQIPQTESDGSSGWLGWFCKRFTFVLTAKSNLGLKRCSVSKPEDPWSLVM